MWDMNDMNGFIFENQNKTGQVKDNTKLSSIIKKICLDVNNKTFLEIGTWNGYGSTKIFVNSLSNRNDTLFYSLECNSEKSMFAKSLYDNCPNVFILNETIIKETPENITDIFPELKFNNEFNRWNKIDTDNMKNCNLFLERTDIPNIFDVIFLDGGEFTTYYEYQILKDKCKYLLLDDTNTNKCSKIVEDLYNNLDKWEILVHDKNERNGILLCSKK